MVVRGTANRQTNRYCRRPIEEAYEVAEAARAKDDAHFREELGDLLLLAVMHAEIAHEAADSTSIM